MICKFVLKNEICKQLRYLKAEKYRPSYIEMLTCSHRSRDSSGRGRTSTSCWASASSQTWPSIVEDEDDGNHNCVDGEYEKIKDDCCLHYFDLQVALHVDQVDSVVLHDDHLLHVFLLLIQEEEVVMEMLTDLYLTQYHPLEMCGMILILMVEEICDVKTFYGQALVEEGNIKMMEAGEVVQATKNANNH